ncbi:MAG: hypothetical protein J6K58_06840 [Lachnospiraceae bacterium]|nr:hypothetical protein [Lachnospiraceae bacterium]MBP3458908.1 hypothetical protein [Lachnospiraceae bacterium]
MSTYLGSRIYNGTTVHRYVANTTEEEDQDCIRMALEICVRFKMKKQEQEKDKKPDSDK